MADKGKKGKGHLLQWHLHRRHHRRQRPPPAHAPPDKKDEKEAKPKAMQPRVEVGTRKGCHRYRWELKDSNREFWMMGHAEVKILAVGCLAASLILFTGTTVHPLLTLIVTMELSIFCFFLSIYTFAIQRYMPFILWPISDLLNGLFACGFLVEAIIFAVRSRQTMPVHYLVAVILMGVAGFFALIDVSLQRKHFKGKKVRKNVLVPPPPKDKRKEESPMPPPDAKPKAPEKAPKKEKVKGGQK
ncbi:LOW QUALITY PROTEIN: CKLF-like MARVEL transmembrane domain-containing protein 2 [Manis pentadactyla]|uniref:LOW QUALITY PROTEIN: CKLF-like MARVEL transmembrane domain-containing protein 2 n=1 Tax=Manis pentadactyla TaxID=143292 RepID=UPI00255C7073|nr:LOW QUALITY PROTEIN: CKLF-like MARVEL transmembrane domain-containing protein 2 [Manis pentadactyla]